MLHELRAVQTGLSKPTLAAPEGAVNGSFSPLSVPPVPFALGQHLHHNLTEEKKPLQACAGKSTAETGDSQKVLS